jgi:hypothetical protein
MTSLELEADEFTSLEYSNLGTFTDTHMGSLPSGHLNLFYLNFFIRSRLEADITSLEYSNLGTFTHAHTHTWAHYQVVI